MSDIFGINPVEGGSTALLIVVFLFVRPGWVVPRNTRAAPPADRYSWRAAHAEEVQARQAERDLTNELLEVARTADHVLASLPAADREEVGLRNAVDRPSR